MKHSIRSIILSAALCGAVSTPAVNLWSQEVSREEFRALAAKVEQLEASLQAMRNGTVEAIASEAASAMPMDRSERQSFIEDVVKAVQVQEEGASFPWMDPDKWARIEKGMDPAEVVSILGAPTLSEPSLHKRIDTVYTYSGRRVATGEKVTGIIRFYDGDAVDIEVPDLR